MLGMMRRDIRAVLERDPAARNTIEVALTYPGLHAVWSHRIAHKMWNSNLKTPARMLSACTRWSTGIEIHPGAELGQDVFIDHGMGVVIGETTVVGDGCTIYHGTTLGGTTLNRGKRHPTLEANVVVGAGAAVLGPITVGRNARIGANAVVLHDVPEGTAVVGVPGQVITRRTPNTPAVTDNENELPDAVGAAVVALMDRVEALERLNGPTLDRGPHRPEHGVWRCEDFTGDDYVI